MPSAMAVAGWTPSWRAVRQASSDDPRTWRKRLRRRILAGWLGLLFAVVVLVSIVVDPESSFSFWYLLLMGGSIAADVAAWRAARRARRAVDAAEASLAAPPVPGRMRLWWSAGDGLGPLAVASLQGFPPSGTIDVPVVGLPEGGHRTHRSM